MSGTNNVMQGQEDPCTAFARSLKQYGDHSYNQTSDHMVIGFDIDLLVKTCTKASNNYDEDLCNFDKLLAEIFKVGEKWLSRNLVEEVVTKIAERHGWHPIKKKRSIQCNRYGEEKNMVREYASGGLKKNCTLKIELKPLVNTRYTAKSQETKEKKKNSYRPDWNAPVEVVEGTCTIHGGDCHPGAQNMVEAKSRAGAYVTKMPNNALYQLCNTAEFGKLSSSKIREVMAKVWPGRKIVDKNAVFNIRVKVMKCMPIFRKSNYDYEAFKEVVNASGMLQGIDNEELNDDEAYTLCQTLWLEIVNTTHSKEEAIFSFLEYLELIKSRAKGFVYKLAEDNSGKKKTLLGVIWMTATMRRNFELFGGYISMDMMKRGINTLLWPYVAVTMYDENMKLCLACEGILCGERVDMYHFVANFLGESAPGRPLSNVNIVAGDGFFDQELIIGLGFINAHYVTDLWHLLDSGLEKMFGKAGYALLKGHLVRMVNATSEAEFEETLQLAEELLAVQPTRDGQLEEVLANFASKRMTYASYCVAQIPGNLGRHGSSISESNHASALVFLNDGKKQGNEFCEHPIILIRELLKRQRLQVTKANKLLWQDGVKMRTVKSNLNKLPRTEETSDLINAAAELKITLPCK
ncbi:hypothetical protein ACHAWC_002749 [Mediolabrus comicus]